MAGHSKWAQIKHKKAATDARKGQLFSKLVREVTIAARLGGPRPDANSRLKAALQRAHAAGLPKENIERALERASGGGEETGLQEFLYEVSGPAGLQVLIEGITDNKNRTLAELKRIFETYGARLTEPGSLLWNFDKIGTLEIIQSDNPEKSREDIELSAIEAGASDLAVRDGVVIAETLFTDTQTVAARIESAGIIIKDIYHDFKPRSVINPAPSEREAMEKFLDALTEHDDVQEAYTNARE